MFSQIHYHMKANVKPSLKSSTILLMKTQALSILQGGINLIVTMTAILRYVIHLNCSLICWNKSNLVF